MQTKKNETIKLGWYPYLCSTFTAIVIAANVFALKITNVFGFLTPCGMLCFPFTYSIGNVITEIYGYPAARRLIYISLFNLIGFYALLYFVIHLTPTPGWTLQKEFSDIFSMSFRIFMGTIAGYLGGELINSKALSILKYITVGRIFIPRAIASTIVGVTTDTILFNIVAFYGVYPLKYLVSFTFQQYFLKIGFEMVGSILAYFLVIYIKKSEKINVTDDYSYKWIDRFSLLNFK